MKIWCHLQYEIFGQVLWLLLPQNTRCSRLVLCKDGFVFWQADENELQRIQPIRPSVFQELLLYCQFCVQHTSHGQKLRAACAKTFSMLGTNYAHFLFCVRIKWCNSVRCMLAHESRSLARTRIIVLWGSQDSSNCVKASLAATSSDAERTSVC